MDNEGYCYVSGRLKDIIIRGGQNIYPAEIEERLLQLPTIAEAVVVGVSDKHYGETSKHRPVPRTALPTQRSGNGSVRRLVDTRRRSTYFGSV